MRSFLLTLALCAVLQAAMAESTSTDRPSAPGNGTAVLQAALAPAPVAQTGSAGSAGAPTLRASRAGAPQLQAGARTGQDDEQQDQHPTSIAMLLAGLAIMTAIALRRRDSHRP